MSFSTKKRWGGTQREKEKGRERSKLRYWGSSGSRVAESRGTVFQASQVNISLYPEHQTLCLWYAKWKACLSSQIKKRSTDWNEQQPRKQLSSITIFYHKNCSGFHCSFRWWKNEDNEKWWFQKLVKLWPLYWLWWCRFLSCLKCNL